MAGVNDYRFHFKIKSDWDENPGKWKQTEESISLGEIIEYGSQTQLNFTDGGTLQFEDIDWANDTVKVELLK